jgi:hypothetical protein
MTVHSFEDARRQREAAGEQPLQPPLKDGGGGGTSDGMAGQGTTIEGRLTRLEGAAVAAFVFLMATFGGGYVLLSNQMNAGTDRLSAKLDAIAGSVSDLKADVAVLEERSKK